MEEAQKEATSATRNRAAYSIQCFVRRIAARWSNAAWTRTLGFIRENAMLRATLQPLEAAATVLQGWCRSLAAAEKVAAKRRVVALAMERHILHTIAHREVCPAFSRLPSPSSYGPSQS